MDDGDHENRAGSVDLNDEKEPFCVSAASFGVPYVEAHHVTPISERQIGSLSASNILTVCANHHRQLHYGDVSIEILETEFAIRFGDRSIAIPRFSAL